MGNDSSEPSSRIQPDDHRYASANRAAFGSPLFVGATDKSGHKNPILGKGAFQYEVVSHNWGELPPHIQWGETHGVAIDETELVYITHRSEAPEGGDAVVVFDSHGKFLRSFGRSFGEKYHTGGHGIDIRKEGNEEFLYLCSIRIGLVTKATLQGEIVWQKGRLLETGKYDDPTTPYSPTNLALAPNDGFYISDGYGSNWIHQFDANANWTRTFGGTGSAPGQFLTPHGLWLDDRPGRTAALVVADRGNGRLQYLSLDGQHLGFLSQDDQRDPVMTSDMDRLNSPVHFPAHFDIQGELLLVPDLHARITLFDKDNRVVTHLGDDPAWTKYVLGDGTFPVRGDRSRWESGRFIHPHDACFDRAGNVFVVEWVPNGRVSFLRRMN